MANPLNQIVTLLKTLYVEREKEAVAIVAGLLSGEPVLLIGPPGTAKTAMVETLARAVNARYYYILMHEYTEPDEIVGPVDVVALRQGIYRRNTEGYLPTAEIAFFDEVFRASGAIRNMLLDVILRRQLRIGNQVVKLPLIAIYAASNFVSREDEDAAFLDRFVIRSYVRYVSETSIEQLIEAGLRLEADGAVGRIAAVKDVLAARERVLTMAKNTPKEVIQKYTAALTVLRRKGLEISDRRKVKLMLVAAAIAHIYGLDRVTEDDMADALRLSATNEKEASLIEEALIEAGLGSITEKLLTMMSEVENVLNELEKKRKDEITVNDIAKVNELANSLRREGEALAKSPRVQFVARRIEQLTARVRAFLQSLNVAT